MAKSFTKSFRTYIKNLGTNIYNVATRRISLSSMLANVKKDTKKVRQSATHTQAHGPARHEAMRLVEKGRRAYNEKNDRIAEEAFREAVLTDPTCAVAYTYLGNVLYRQGRVNEAVGNWNRAAVTDPDSEASASARRKLQRVAAKKKDMNAWLDEEIKERLKDV